MKELDAFEAAYGRAPEGCWAAPGRVNLIGEYTDLNDGFVLPFAIPLVTRAWAAPREGRLVRIFSLQGHDREPVALDLDGSARPSGWHAYPLAVGLAFEAEGYRLGGADIMIDSEVPVGAGLSSSAALECSVAMALCAFAGVDLAPMQIARYCRRAENEFVGMPCGIMDQAASMCCQAGNALFLDTRDYSARQVPFDVQAAGMALVVVDTGVKHALAESAYAERKKSCAEAARLLGVRALRDVPAAEARRAVERLAQAGGDEVARRARHVFSEQARVLQVAQSLDAGRLSEIGSVLVEGHRSLRDDFEVSCPELDTVVEAAMAAGAYGARLTGAGFGGSAIVLVRQKDISEVEKAVASAFARHGWAAPRAFTVVPSAGGRRES